MRLPEFRQPAVLIRRYQRFLADVRLAGGQILTVPLPQFRFHAGLLHPGSPVIISRSDNRGRNTRGRWKWCRKHGVWIGVHTGRTNGLVREALENGVIDDFGGIVAITPEVVVSARSRLDFLIETDRGQVYVEVKNCSLAEHRTALFPDAVTTRGAKHIAELVQLREGRLRRRGRVLRAAWRCRPLQAGGTDRSGLCPGGRLGRGLRRAVFGLPGRGRA